MFFFPRSKVFYLLSQVKVILNIYIFYVFKGQFFCFISFFLFLGVIHCFGHHGRPASQIFNLCISFNYFHFVVTYILTFFSLSLFHFFACYFEFNLLCTPKWCGLDISSKLQLPKMPGKL